MQKTLQLREGFWHSDEDKSLPLPRPRKLRFIGQNKFLEGLNYIQENHPQIQKYNYKGWSTCRCCQKKNGSAQYALADFGSTWTWPSGFLHYVDEHNVRPSLAFQEWVKAVYDELTKPAVPPKAAKKRKASSK